MTNTERHEARKARLKDPVYMAELEARMEREWAADRARPEWATELWLSFERDYWASVEEERIDPRSRLVNA